MHFIQFNHLKKKCLVLEVANAEYGNFNKPMAIAAVDDRWRLSSGFIANSTNSSCQPPMEQFQLETPIVDKHQSVTRVESYDSHDVRQVPSEWSKFWVLVGRCHIHLYRDWVNIICFCYYTNKKYVCRFRIILYFLLFLVLVVNVKNL